MTFRPISPTITTGRTTTIPDHTFGGTRERFEENKISKLNSFAPSPATYDIRLNSYERNSSRSAIYPYERCSSPKMYHQILPSSLISKTQANSVGPGNYEIQRWGSPSTIPPAYLSSKNTSSFTNISREQGLGSSTCRGESKFYNESKWEEKLRSYSPGPGSYDVSSISWKRKSPITSPTSVTDRVSSPILRNSNSNKPWNEYKQQQQQEDSATVDAPGSNRKMSKTELIEKQQEIASVKRLPNIILI